MLFIPKFSLQLDWMEREARVLAGLVWQSSLCRGAQPPVKLGMLELLSLGLPASPGAGRDAEVGNASSQSPLIESM